MSLPRGFGLRPAAHCPSPAQGILYTITDVVDLHLWMAGHLDAHPLFQRLTDAEMVRLQILLISTHCLQAVDPIISKLATCTEEGKKVKKRLLFQYSSPFV